MHTESRASPGITQTDPAGVLYAPTVRERDDRTPGLAWFTAIARTCRAALSAPRGRCSAQGPACSRQRRADTPSSGLPGNLVRPPRPRLLILEFGERLCSTYGAFRTCFLQCDVEFQELLPWLSGSPRTRLSGSAVARRAAPQYSSTGLRRIDRPVHTASGGIRNARSYSNRSCESTYPAKKDHGKNRALPLLRREIVPELPEPDPRRPDDGVRRL